MDLNADLGESFGAWHMGDDDAMMQIVTSANIACGFHGGDPAGILATLRSAVAAGVRIGAHPSYRDLAGFGRRPMSVPAAELTAEVAYQVAALQGLARSAGGEMAYVKPHGALYNTMAADLAVADAVIDAVLLVAPDAALMGLAGSAGLARANERGLAIIAEAFVDRGYRADGTLLPRTEPGALIHDADAAAARMVTFARDGVIEATDGSLVALQADSICVHGDSAAAVEMAAKTKAALLAAGVVVAAPA